MIIVAILLGMALIGVMIKQILLKKEISRIADKIEQMATEESNALLTVRLPDQAVISLVKAVNESQKSHQEIVIKTIRQSEEFKQSMADISHDLRTPLTALAGYLKLMKEEESPAKQEKHLAIANEKAEILNYLVMSLFELARLESNAYPFEWKSIDLTEVLASELASFYPQFMKQQQEPTVSVIEEPLWIMSDDMALQRIFDNLLQNALRHGQGGIEIKVYQEENQAITEISNQIEHLKDDEVTQLFNRNYKTEAARNRKGAGLGLAITKAFVEAMKGTIESRLEKEKLVICMKLPLQHIKYVDK